MTVTLNYVFDDEPGLTRSPSNSGLVYFCPDGRPVRGKALPGIRRRIAACPKQEATLTQTLPDWIGAHVRAFKFLGGVPEVVVPDNLKSAVPRQHSWPRLLPLNIKENPCCITRRSRSSSANPVGTLGIATRAQSLPRQTAG